MPLFGEILAPTARTALLLRYGRLSILFEKPRALARGALFLPLILRPHSYSLSNLKYFTFSLYGRSNDNFNIMHFFQV